MRTLVLILVFFYTVAAQKTFQPEHFIDKDELKLPTISQEMLYTGDHTHPSNTREYFYHESTEKLDSIVELLTIDGGTASRSIQRYSYSGDTAYMADLIVDTRIGDTLHGSNVLYTDDYKTKEAQDLGTNCIWRSEFDKRGIKLLDVKKCPGDQEFRGQEFILETKQKYIESIEKYRGEVDSNNIRRYYLAPFDSIVADYMVMKEKEPFIVRLNTYGENNRKTMSYGFGIYTRNFEVVEMDKYTYTDQGKLHRVYHFDVKEGDPNLVNYTEYEYDKLGRKVRVTTRVKPEEKSERGKSENAGK